MSENNETEQLAITVSPSIDEDTYGLMADVLAKVRGELDDHREAINENTNEIQLNQEFLTELSTKIDKLTERIDDLTLLVKCGRKECKKEWDIAPLTSREKEIFHTFYILSEERNNACTYAELARRTKASVSSITGCIASFVAKGLPVVKRYAGGKAFVGLDPAFRQVQAKQNIVGVNTLLTYWQG